MHRAELVRYSVASTFATCGAGLVICANRADFLRNIVRNSDVADEWDMGAQAFGVGMLALLAITFALLIDGIVRSVFKLRARNIHFGVRTLLIAVTLFALVGALVR